MPNKAPPPPRKGIPVPRDVGGGSSRRSVGPSRASGAAAGGGGADHPNNQQPPWRSSLDLVWSYSRSQAFYGDNIATSPSFVERHWAGKDLEEGSSSIEDHDGEDYSSYDDEDDDHDDEVDDRDDEPAASRDDELSLISREEGGEAAPYALEWDDDHLPPNAVRRRDNRVRPRDRRRIIRFEGDGRGDADRNRSRSRSPKRLGEMRARQATASRSRLGDVAPERASAAAGSRDWPATLEHEEDEMDGVPAASEATPLVGALARERPKSSSHTSLTHGLASTAEARRRVGRYGTIGRSGPESMQAGSSSQVYVYGQGTSTFLQSWFNTVNALVGVGILALPLAFSYAGWLGGTLLFLVCGLLTNYTGKVLARIMWREPSLRTYADIGSYAFGPGARLFVSLFFCLELWAVSVALIILFGDSMAAIFPSLPSAAFKAIGFGLVLPTVFLPLKLLSPISVVGIVSTVTLVLVVISDGLIKSTPPGSILHPAHTTLGPRWGKLPLSFGLIMSGFSSHPVIPSLVKDMKDPHQFPRMLNLAYLAATLVYLAMGMAGYAMFGTDVTDEITRDLAKTPQFPRWLNHGAIWLIVINPLSKFALATRPVQTTVETLLGLDPAEAVALDGHGGRGAKRRASAYSARSVQSNVDGALGGGASGAGANPSGNGTAPGAIDQKTDLPALASDPSTHAVPLTDPTDIPTSAPPTSSHLAEPTSPPTSNRTVYLRILIRTLLTLLVTATAIVLPGFEKVMAFLGAFLAFTTCIFGPLLANLALFRTEMSRSRIVLDATVLAVSAVGATMGTVWAFLP